MRIIESKPAEEEIQVAAIEVVVEPAVAEPCNAKEASYEFTKEECELLLAQLKSAQLIIKNKLKNE